MSMSTNPPDLVRMQQWLMGLQDAICADIEQLDGAARFHEDTWQRAEGGGGRTRILRDGAVFEQAGINFSHVSGTRLPPSATAQRPELAGCGFEAMGEVAKALEAALGEAESVKAIWKPQTTIPVDEERAQSLMKLVGTLEDDDDVQNVYTNFEVDDATMAKLSAA